MVFCTDSIFYIPKSSIQNGSHIQNGNYPQGEIKVTAHGGNEMNILCNLIWNFLMVFRHQGT